MDPLPIHPYRALWETRDVRRFEESLSPNVVVRSPIIEAPFEGKDAVTELWEILLQNLSDFRITHEFGERNERVFFWSATASGERIQGCDLIRSDDDGAIVELSVIIRPLTAIAALAAAIGPPLAGRRSWLRGLIARPLIGSLRIFLRLADAAATRLASRR